MILVLVGTHPAPFNRLLKTMDKLIESGELKEEVVAQLGISDYKPKYLRSKDFFGEKERERLIKKSSVVITHAGAGNIIDCINKRKKIVVVPRLKKFGEHNNNHQLELAKALETEGKVTAVYNIDALGTTILHTKKLKPKFQKESTLAEKLCRYVSDLK